MRRSPGTSREIHGRAGHGSLLAALMRDIPPDRISSAVIEGHIVNHRNVTLGAQDAAVVLPIPDKIRVRRDQICTVSGPTSPIAQGDPRR